MARTLNLRQGARLWADALSMPTSLRFTGQRIALRKAGALRWADTRSASTKMYGRAVPVPNSTRLNEPDFVV